MNAVAGGSDVSAAGEVLDLHYCIDISYSFVILYPSSFAGPPGKLAGHSSATKNWLQGRTIDRFVKDPAKLIMNFESMMNDFVSSHCNLFLGLERRCCNRQGSRLGRKMVGQKNVKQQTSLLNLSFLPYLFAPTFFCPVFGLLRLGRIPNQCGSILMAEIELEAAVQSKTLMECKTEAHINRRWVDLPDKLRD
jgi:hypothetical protein